MAKPIVHHRMRTLAYHESALLYNKKVAECLRELVIADEMTDKEVKRWCMSQARQHEKHIPFHERSIRRLRKQKQQKKEAPRNNSKTRNSPNPSPPKRKEGADTKQTPVRPIPRDPRLNKRPAVGTSISEEKQETSA